MCLDIISCIDANYPQLNFLKVRRATGCVAKNDEILMRLSSPSQKQTYWKIFIDIFKLELNWNHFLTLSQVSTHVYNPNLRECAWMGDTNSSKFTRKTCTLHAEIFRRTQANQGPSTQKFESAEKHVQNFLFENSKFTCFSMSSKHRNNDKELLNVELIFIIVIGVSYFSYTEKICLELPDTLNYQRFCHFEYKGRNFFILLTLPN